MIFNAIVEIVKIKYICKCRLQSFCKILPGVEVDRLRHQNKTWVVFQEGVRRVGVGLVVVVV